MTEILPVPLISVVAVACAASSIGVSLLVGPRRPNPTKLGAYESGNEPLADVPGKRPSVKFYLVAMLFFVFDAEAVFVYPWAVVLRKLGWAGLWKLVAFLGNPGVALVRDRPRRPRLGLSSPSSYSKLATKNTNARFGIPTWECMEANQLQA